MVLWEKIGYGVIILCGEVSDVLFKLVCQIGVGVIYVSDWFCVFMCKVQDVLCKVLGDVMLCLYVGYLLIYLCMIWIKIGGSYKVYIFFVCVVCEVGLDKFVNCFCDIVIVVDLFKGEDLVKLNFVFDMCLGVVVLDRYVLFVGEDVVVIWFEWFLDYVKGYGEGCDWLDMDVILGLVEVLVLGEISLCMVWVCSMVCIQDDCISVDDVCKFLFEVLWWEFVWYLLVEFLQMDSCNWCEDWMEFFWRLCGVGLEVWQQVCIGIFVVDVGLCEMWVMGRMYNCVCMIVVSYLIKYLMIDWCVGLWYFVDSLIDWDLVSNVMNW